MSGVTTESISTTPPVISITGAPTPTLRQHAYEVVRWALGAVLILAAVMKGWDMHRGVPTGVEALSVKPVVIAIVTAEWLLGLWLIGGNRPRETARLTFGVFGVLAVVAAYKGWSGAGSCGCLGRITVSPWGMLGVDVAAMAALAMTMPGSGSVLAPLLIAKSWALLGLGATVPAVVLMSMAGTPTLGDGGTGDVVGGLVVLDPEKWAGKPLGLLRFIDARDQLATDSWLVVLYHHDCESCRSRLGHYEELAAGGRRVMLLELPPYGVGPHDPVSPGTRCVRSRLSREREWLVQTPAEIEMRDGVVVRGRQGVGSHP